MVDLPDYLSGSDSGTTQDSGLSTSDFISDDNEVQWRRLGQTIIGGLFLAWVGTVVEVWIAIRDGLRSGFSMFSEHYVELIERPVDAFGSSMRIAVANFETTVGVGVFGSTGWGLSAWIIAVISTVIILWIISEVVGRVGI